MALTWKESLQRKLIQQYGNKTGILLSEKYLAAFPHNYAEDYAVAKVCEDITYLEKLSADYPLAINLYFSNRDQDYPLHLRLFQWARPVPLSDIMPMLENLGLRSFSETPYKLTLAKNQLIWISDYAITYARGDIQLNSVKPLFEEALLKVYRGEAENDGFNKLILGASMSWREVMLLRAYAKYLRQVGFRFSQAYIEKALLAHAAITQQLVNLFLTLHDPKKIDKSKKSSLKIEQHILQALESVTSLDEDRILHRLLDLIKATLRTNYFQTTPDGHPKNYLSLKLNSRIIPDLPLPVPLYEIFVYAPHFEAIHLRYTKVARGGIRWSDRLEDFRTEILGLMKAQVVKNAVIVPSGAKGGFVLKSIADKSREAIQNEVIRCYQSFISGLLDITDNIHEKEFIRPTDVVCYDDVDPYLVVAADKGTAAFSDIANSISKQNHFWLGDAFASGGSTGYDHKKMGITARGAWESIKRHFRELDRDITSTPMTVIGIGDMSGDVFGNGMIYSKQIKLVGAFDHRHIFLDPTPDPDRSFEERLRLFKLPASSWEDYNPNLISKGGGVFKRTLKSIPLSPQIKQLLDVNVNSLTPNELICAMLKAPVDLLFNGGIGTYVKAAQETAADVGDRSNDYCRVNGGQLRCKVVGEGGNLGFTQLGRVEYALTGGLINTDFIDNSAGVDCSDHEVNLKILLDQIVHQGKLSQKQRNVLLASLTQEVAELVLQDNYQQALVMSFSAYHAKRNITLHQNYIKELESNHTINRAIEFLPDDKTLVERKAAGLGLTRPELATLLAYTKIYIKHKLLESELLENPYLNDMLQSAFPPSISKKYKHALSTHRLHRDIIATQLSNHVINNMGITFVYRMQSETGARVADIVCAYLVAESVFGTHELQKRIVSLDYRIPMTEQYDMLFNLRTLISLSTRWFLQNNRLKGKLEDIISHYADRVRILEEIIPNLMGGFARTYLASITDKFLKAGLAKEVARHIATYRAIYTSLNIIEVATQHHFDLIKTAEVYFSAGERMSLVWFRDQIANDQREGYWNSLARVSLRDELDVSQRALTVAILKDHKKEAATNKLIEHWLSNNAPALDRWGKLLEMLHGSTDVEYTMFFVVIRELLSLIKTSLTTAK